MSIDLLLWKQNSTRASHIPALGLQQSLISSHNCMRRGQKLKRSRVCQEQQSPLLRHQFCTEIHGSVRVWRVNK